MKTEGPRPPPRKNVEKTDRCCFARVPGWRRIRLACYSACTPFLDHTQPANKLWTNKMVAVQGLDGRFLSKKRDRPKPSRSRTNLLGNVCETMGILQLTRSMLSVIALLAMLQLSLCALNTLVEQTVANEIAMMTAGSAFSRSAARLIP